jgi:protein gp37
MGATGIEWTRGPNGEQGYTFNPWIGCTRVSPACDHCYAADLAPRYGVVWDGPPKVVSEASWAAMLTLNRKAARLGVRYRVFVASMADVLDKNAFHEWRDRLWKLIETTPHLDWLILTKRPQLARRYMPKHWFTGSWPKNAWFGITGENQAEFDRRWLWACDIPAPVLFVSVEPMLSAIDILWTFHPIEVGQRIFAMGRIPPKLSKIRRPDWIIAGGESGTLANCRDTPVEHFRSLNMQCQTGGVAFFMKQMPQISFRKTYKKFDQFPDGLRIREQPKIRGAKGAARR